MKKFHYFYRIVNLINGKYYYGVHSTDNIDDGYMGSGTLLKEAYKKYGVINFKKEILKYFTTRSECLAYEASVVNKSIVSDNECYNIALGGLGSTTPSGTITTRDSCGNVVCVNEEDERWLNGDLIGLTKGFTNCFDIETKKYVQVPNEEFQNSDRYVGITSLKVPCKLIGDNTYILIDADEFWKNRDKYVFPTQNKVVCRDNSGKYYALDSKEAYEGIKSGELHHVWENRSYTEESRKKMSNTHKRNCDQQGEKNSQFGTCWITKDKINRKIPLDDLPKYTSLGWIRGRIMKSKEG